VERAAKKIKKILNKKKFKKILKNGTLVIQKQKNKWICNYEYKRKVSIYQKYRRIALHALFIPDTDG
jgi:hypothetical protein